ncbi:IS110 family transposase, partial [Streptomyces erythrochromogenes]|uniref:IS110 family transposase n=1 Tax=Streptomyces erythrochromogenes TaxID=285574 RepID=UPI0038018DC4
MPELWAGTDAGKAAHHCTVIDTDGTKVLSRRVPNNEPELLGVVVKVSGPHQDRCEGDGCLVGLGGLDAPM